LRAITPKGEMKLLLILLFVCPLWAQAPDRPQGGAPSSAQPAASAVGASSANQTSAGSGSMGVADADARKARQIVDRGIQALGGNAYLTIHDIEEQGRGWGFHHGQSTGGDLFWSFYEYPDKERVEYTKERDVARVFVGDKGYEITYRGPRPVEQKDLTDYLRQRHYALDVVLRTWVNDPGVIFLYEGNAIAAQHPAEQVTLINAKNESVTLDFDAGSHLPIRKAFEWRDPVDRQKNLEEEIYDNYRQISGVMVPFNVTRLFNGDMSRQRFVFAATINQPLDEAMFNPNSGYDPNKPEKKAKR
jgi:hypothetical protein